MVPLAFILPDPLVQPQHRASDADLPGPWTPVPASASVGVSPPASPGWASRAPERWSLLQSLAGLLCYPVSRARRQGHGGSVHVQNRVICASLAPPA